MQEQLVLIVVAAVSHLVGLFVGAGYHIVAGRFQCAPAEHEQEEHM